MAKRGTGMSDVIEQGHHVATKAPSLGKGTYQAVGTFIDEGDMTTTSPKGTSVNVKSGKTQTGE